MKATNPHNHTSLARQLKVQKNLQWDLEMDIPWSLGIDKSKYFLPLDSNNLVFPGASTDQKRALSQLMGLIVNSTISEMEDALPRVKYYGWEKLLRAYPANPELVELGEMFFEEELKHARAFKRYEHLFCEELGIEPGDLDGLVPKAYGSNFQRAINKNAEAGGHAFWWVVAATEEVSIAIFHEIDHFQAALDPLYFALHRKHLEEESRHANYAYLMLECIGSKQDFSFNAMWHKQLDYVWAQLVSVPWVMKELSKILACEKLAPKHEFFATIASCVPLMQRMSKRDLITSLFISVPYVSWLVNPSWRNHCQKMAAKHGAFTLPMPKPLDLEIAS